METARDQALAEQMTVAEGGEATGRPLSQRIVVGRGSDMSLASSARALARCGFRVLELLARRHLRMPRDKVGLVIGFADGTSAPVYRETVVVQGARSAPVFLAVSFRLRLIKGNRWGHALFRAESILNTVLFAGFRGLVSKLWLRHDQHDVYRGLYEYESADLAERYVNALWWVLALVSEPDSIRYVIVPGLFLDDLLAKPSVLDDAGEGAEQWWRPISYSIGDGMADPFERPHDREKSTERAE